MPSLLDSIDEDGRLYGRHEAQDAERRHPRQPRDGFHGDRVGRIRRLSSQEGNARAIRPGAGRHRAVFFCGLSEGFGHPLQGEQGLLRREAAGRRSRLRHHARRDRALRQAQGGRMPRQRLSAPGRPRRDAEGSVAEGDQRLRASTSLSGPSTCNKPPLDKKEVRQALSMAIDRDAIIKDVYLGAGEKAKTLDPAHHVVLQRRYRRLSLRPGESQGDACGGGRADAARHRPLVSAGAAPLQSKRQAHRRNDAGRPRQDRRQRQAASPTNGANTASARRPART